MRWPFGARCTARGATCCAGRGSKSACMSPRRRALRRRCRANFWRCSRRSKDAHCGGELTPPLQRRGLYGSNRRGAHYVTAMTKYLHTMIRVTDPDATVAFFKLIGLNEVRRFDNAAGRFTLIFLAPPGQEGVAEASLARNRAGEGKRG